MASILNFSPLFQETADTIRARVNADANVGLSPTDPSYLDTTPGGFWYDVTQALILEIERLWDAISVEYLAAMFPAYAWGIYLDEHGITLNVPRKAASAATGQATFAGTDGTYIAAGTQVAVATVNPDDVPLTFATVEAGTITSGVLTVDIVARATGSESNVAPGQITLMLTPVDAVASVTNAAATSGGADIEDDEAYRQRLLIAYAGAHGSGTVDDYVQWALAYAGVGHATVVPVWAGAGTVKVSITDPNNDPSSTLVVAGLQNQLDPPNASTTVATGGTMPFTPLALVDASGFDTGGGKFQIVHGGVPQILTYTGKSGNNLTGVAGGTGTLSIGDKVTAGGRGSGLAPIGAFVTVTTPIGTAITISATITCASGYSINGAGGTVDISADIKASILDYVNRLNPGDDVILQHVASRLFVTGVLDVSLVKIDTVAANLAIDDNHIAQLAIADITLS